MDCFEAAEVKTLVGTLGGALEPGGLWYVVDFHVPDTGWMRPLSRGLLALMYTLFRLETGISAQTLTDPLPLLERAGLRVLRRRTLSGGLLRALLCQMGQGGSGQGNSGQDGLGQSS